MCKQASERVAVGLALLAFVSLAALAQETEPAEHMNAGRSGLDGRGCQEAEEQLMTAREEAEAFRPSGPSPHQVPPGHPPV
jgi:hypothetical protein